MNYFGVPQIRGPWGVPARTFGVHKARPVPGTAQANAEAENDEVPFFSGACDHVVKRIGARAKKWNRNVHLLPQDVEVHWSGEARARPRDANFLRGAGGCLAVLFSVCMSVTGQPLKNTISGNRVFVLSAFRQLERPKTVNKHVCEKISCSSFSKTPSMTPAERF